MRWMLIFVAMTIAGCGKPEPDNSMKSVVQSIRDAPLTPTKDRLYEKTGRKPDTTEDERPTREGDRSYQWVRFPASDGFVWVKIVSVKDGGHMFIPSTIQFSQSGKRE